ncbi:MAG: ATP-binding cassette domain-containing protein, partial [Oligoflexales bacterium]|nr:ATP-binding cassette domain-containing protein [Oligoflexales bacterium]
MLTVKELNVFYGAIHALKDISLNVAKGEIVTLIGANGAGKSTTLRALSGLIRPRSGTITFLGTSIEGQGAHKIVRGGLSHCPEGRRIFGRLTVRENLLLGAYFRKDKRQVENDLARNFDLFP